MNVTRVIERLMNRLGAIPGLSFLGGYVVSAKATHTRFGQRKGDYEAYVNNLRRAGGDVRELTGRGEEDGYDEEDEVGDSSLEEDYYDDYDSDDFYRQSGSNPEDDYPASDDNISYFNDDYRSQ